MKYSVSNINLFNECRLKWYFRYGLKIKNEDITANHPFIVGHLLHDSIEYGLDTAVNNYYSKFPIIDNKHIDEVIKVSHWYNNYLVNIVPDGINEYKLEDNEFIGYIDLVVENKDGTYDIWDFKYSNNIKIYKESIQLHVYKYYFEKLTGYEVNKLKYLFVPKVNIKQQITESIENFRLRLNNELSKLEPTVIEIKYNPSKVDKFFNTIKIIEDDTTELSRNKTTYCWWCDYKNICNKVDI